MDKKVENFLINMDFTKEDIRELLSVAPGLGNISYEWFADCIEAVTDAGYPQADIDSLIFSNPTFLTQSPEFLKCELSSIGGDIEEKLKQNPYLI